MTASTEVAHQTKSQDGSPVMSDGERQQAFIQAMQAAEQKYGFTVVSTIQVDGLGPVMTLGQSPIKPGPVSIAAVEGWQPSSNKADAPV
jgi:hypothetical protein